MKTKQDPAPNSYDWTKQHKELRTIEDIEKFFWKWYPHETSWMEFKECNIDLYAQVINAGKALVMAGKMKSVYLPKEAR